MHHRGVSLLHSRETLTFSSLPVATAAVYDLLEHLSRCAPLWRRIYISWALVLNATLAQAVAYGLCVLYIFGSGLSKLRIGGPEGGWNLFGVTRWNFNFCF